MSSSQSTKKDKPHKKSVIHRLLERWARTHKEVVQEKTHNLKKPGSSRTIKRRMPVKLILLGTENSGKSTVAKQLKTTYQDGYTLEEKKSYLPLIQTYILGNIKDILLGVDKFNFSLSPEMQKIANHVSSLPKTHTWTIELVEMMKTLLLDSVMSKFMLKCAELQLYDNLTNLLTKLDSFVSPNYVPTIEDILKIHTRTTGVLEIAYKLNEIDYRVLDLGGCRSEQRKWLFFFENVTAVVFVVALNEYDMQLREDPTVNRMHESLRLFSFLVNNIYFRQTPIVLLLNKTDLFMEKIQRRPLYLCFPEYTGGSNYDSAYRYIETKFRSLDSSTERKIYTYATCSINGEMQSIFEEVMQNVL